MLLLSAVLNPGAASANFTSAFTLTPSTTAAGAHPDLSAAFSFSGATGVKSLSFTLPQGLHIAPAAVAAPCSLSDSAAGNCAAASRIGTISAGALNSATATGDLYLTAPPTSSDVAGISMVLRFDGGLGTLTAQGAFGLNNLGATQPNQTIAFGDIPDVTSTGTSVSLTQLTFTLSGTVGSPPHPLVTNPSTCPTTAMTATSTATAVDNTTAQSAASYPATGCNLLPFAPTFDEVYSNPGAGQATNATFTLDLPLGSSSLKRLTLKLAPTVWTNFSAMGSAADMCPSSSMPSYINLVFNPTNCPPQAQIGSISMTTPLVAAPITGAIYLVSKSPIPGFGISLQQGGVGLFFGGNESFPQVDITCDVVDQGWCESQIAVTLMGLPEMPVTNLQIAFGHAGRVSSNGYQLSNEFFNFAPAGDGSCVSPSDTLAIATPYNGTAAVTATDAVGIDGCGGAGAGDPPETILTSSPPAATHNTMPSFSFTSADTTATFECKLDTANYLACSSPFTVASALADGAHRFRVRAVNAAGPDPTPIDYSFTVDTTPPVVSITSPTADSFINSANESVAFSVTDAAATTTTCQLDSGSVGSCSSPFGTGTLSEGPHTVTVTATDIASNTGTAAVSFTVDTTPPVVTITSAPNGTTSNQTPSIGFTFDDQSATIACSVDDGTPVTCSSPFATPQLGEGPHTVTVTATDAAGNAGSATASFSVTTAGPPETTIDSGPAEGSITTNRTPTFTFSSDTGVSFECKVDAVQFASCSSPFSAGSLPDGPHTFSVRAVDTAGNADQTFASRTFVVDATPPVVTITVPVEGDTTLTALSAATFSVADQTPTTTSCRIDTGPTIPCTSPFDAGPLDVGLHTLAVTADDAAGNRGVAYADFSIRNVDTTRVEVQDGVLKYEGTADAPHFVAVSFDAATALIKVYDAMEPMVAGPGCVANAQSGVDCAAAGIASIEIDGADQQDWGMLVGGGLTIPSVFKGGSGDDTFFGDDNNDVFEGGSGSDSFIPGDGINTISYADHDQPVGVDLNAQWFGSAGEYDTVRGAGTVTNIIGGSGNDVLAGNAGDNTIDGGPGDDTIDGRAGSDTISGGPGNDTIEAADGEVDTITCGDGVDHVHADYNDIVASDCESVSIALETFVDSGPDDTHPALGNHATFDFSSTNGTSYECSLDSGPFLPCASPYTTPQLDRGYHEFAVRAIDADGPDPTPAIRTFDANYGALAQVDNGQLTVDSADEWQDDIAVSQSAGQFVITAADSGGAPGVVAGSGCTKTATGPVDCSDAGVNSVSVSTYDGNDTIGSHTQVPATLNGGTGDDTIDGWNEADTLIGGQGADHFNSSGPGSTVSYADRTDDIHASLDGVANDGAVGEGDNLGAGITAIVGGAGNDVLVGNDQANRLDGGPGRDDISAGGGDDTVLSNDGGVDHIACGDGTDTVVADGVDTTDADCEQVTVTSHTAISDGPAPGATIAQSTATFAFDAPSADSFECRVDSGEFAPCSSPYTTPQLDDGIHEFQVRAIVGGAPVDSTPASRTFTVDTQSPIAYIESAPDQQTNDAQPSFSFDSPDDSTFKCRLDDGAFASCTSPFTVSTPLASGDHSFSVLATDLAGNVQATATTFDFNVDREPPDTVVATSLTPDAILTGGAALVNLIPTEGDGETFECQVDGAGFNACEDPWQVQLSDGEHVLQARAVDVSGNADPAPWSIHVTVAPDAAFPHITGGPADGAHVSGDSVEFSFNGTNASSFECSVDSAAYAACDSPFDVPTPVVGIYTFSVRAVDQSGQMLVPPATRSFTVDSTRANGPSVAITDGPGATPSDTNTPQFSFSSPVTSVSFGCAIDGGYFSYCESPFVTPELSDGSHTFAVRATDSAGDTGSAVYRAFTVDTGGTPAPDTTEPETEITTGPVDGDTVNTPTVAYGFTASEPATFECQIDDQAYQSCLEGTVSYTLTDGTHTFRVRAIDGSGNVDSTPAEQTVNVDTTAPDAPTFASHPDSSVDNTASFSIDGEANASFEYRLDGGDWTACGTSVSLANLAGGNHTVEIRQTDRAGNVSTTTSYTWSSSGLPPAGPGGITLVQPEPGSSYVSWRTPGQPGAPAGVVGYEVRHCVHPIVWTCADNGEGTVQSDWQHYDATSGRSSELFDVKRDFSVDYEIKSIDASGNETVLPSTVASPNYGAGVQIKFGSSTLNPSPGGYVAQNSSLGSQVTVQDSGVGIKRIGLACVTYGGHGDDAIPLNVEHCTSSSAESFPLAERFGMTGPNVGSVLGSQQIDCQDANDPRAPGKLTCPKTWTGNLDFPLAGLLPINQDPVRLMVFTEDRAGNITYKYLSDTFDLDNAPPAQVNDVQFNVDQGQAIADWSSNGDPNSGKNAQDGSGVDHFDFRYRVNDGAWSATSTQSADQDWTNVSDLPNVSAGDKVDFEITAFDEVGQKSQPTLTTATATDPGPDDLSADSATTDNATIAADLETDWSIPTIWLYGHYASATGTNLRGIRVETSLFPANVDQSNPGDPIDTETHTCGPTKLCELYQHLPASAGLPTGDFVTRTVVRTDDDGGYTTAGTSWSDVITVDPVPDDYTTPDASDEGSSIADSTSSGATTSAALPFFKGCWTKFDTAPGNFDPASPAPRQYQCRWGRAVSSAKKHVSDDGRHQSYAAIPKKYKKVWQYPKIILNNKAKGNKGFWPLYDSFGNKKFLLRTDPTHHNWDVETATGTPIERHFKPTSRGAKVQGKACFVGGHGLRNNTAVLLKLDFGSTDWDTRLFINIKAFPSGIWNSLRRTDVGCHSEVMSPDKTVYTLTNPDIGDIKFKQSGSSPGARTYKTYNARPNTNTMYAALNTNSVYQGGIARGVVPAQGMQFRLVGYTGYCDVNAFHAVSGGGLTPQPGLQWAYGRFVDPNHPNTKLYGWVPIAALRDSQGKLPSETLGGAASPLCPTGIVRAGG